MRVTRSVRVKFAGAGERRASAAPPRLTGKAVATQPGHKIAASLLDAQRRRLAALVGRLTSLGFGALAHVMPQVD
jgi:hypothetical protein